MAAHLSVKQEERVRFPAPPQQNIMYKVYYTNKNGEPHSYDIESLSEALDLASYLRKNNRFVTMCSENPDSVGMLGVDAVIDGKLPDGTDYEWKKRRL